MNNQFWSGLKTAGLTTTFGSIVFLFSSLTGSVASNPKDQGVSLKQLSDPSTTIQADIQPYRSVKLNTTILQLGTRSQESVIATIHPHRWKDRLAVTLRVRDIPVLTFLGSASDLSASGRISEQSNAIVRAKAVAHRLNQLSQDNTFDARTLKVSWEPQRQAYSITFGQEELIKVDRQTILPDTTNNLAADALQATNRLRRLMGNASPLTQIAGKSPESLAQAAQAITGKVKSNRKGMASWYGPGFHGRRTANGERYNQHGMTAAHRSLPFGTRIRVINLRNGRSVVVRVNDRGPYSGRRIIDLSAGAARAIGLVGSGIGPVQLEILGR